MNESRKRPGGITNSERDVAERLHAARGPRFASDVTLRDLFAAAALAGMATATEAYENDSIQRRATLAYAYADAMLGSVARRADPQSGTSPTSREAAP